MQKDINNVDELIKLYELDVEDIITAKRLLVLAKGIQEHKYSRLDYISVQKASWLMRISGTAVHAKIMKGQLIAKKIKGPNGGGRGGYKYMIPVAALPIDVQLDYYEILGTEVL